MPANLSPLLDGNNGTLSMTLGLGDPLDSTFSMAEAKLILGRQIKEPSLYVHSGVAQPALFVAGSGYVGTAGGGDGAGSGSSGGEASSPDGNAGSGNSGGDGDGP